MSGKELTSFTPRLRGDEFLQPFELLNGELSPEAALRIDGPAVAPARQRLVEDEVTAVRTGLREGFEPTEAEEFFLAQGIDATASSLRALAVESDFIAARESQARAVMNNIYTPIPPPLMAGQFSQVAIFTTEMDESRFAKRVKSHVAYKHAHDELGGIRLLLYQIFALVILWPNCGTMPGLADRILVALDQMLGKTRFFIGQRLRGISRRNPESFIEVLLQLFNVGMLYVYGVNSDNVRSPTSNRALSFLAEIPRATGIPVMLSGSCALLNHLREQPAAGSELLHNQHIEISSYGFADGSRAASSYWAGLPPAIRELISEQTMAEILQKSGFQRRLYVKAATAVVDEIMNSGMSSKDDQLAVADAALSRHKGVLIAISEAAKGNPISGEYKTRFQEFLPLSTQYISVGKKNAK